MDIILALLAGTLYGLVIGIIPSAGATTGLVALFGVIHFFVNDPYLGVVFLMAVVLLVPQATVLQAYYWEYPVLTVQRPQWWMDFH